MVPVSTISSDSDPGLKVTAFFDIKYVKNVQDIVTTED